MIIKRKNYSYSEVNPIGSTYHPAQIINDTVGYTEGAIDLVDQSKIGQAPPVKKKTRMVKNVISGIKAYMPKRKKKKPESK
jgi:hypothetical protein